MKILNEQEIDLKLIDDQKDILDLSEIFLAKENDKFKIGTTSNQEEIIDSVEQGGTDAIVSDYEMPGMNGIELLENVREIDENLPFLLYTGKGTEEVATKAIRAGVTDYMQKKPGTDHYALMANSIENAVKNYRETERAEILSSMVEMSNQPVLVTDNDSKILYVNEALEEISGYDSSELIGEEPSLLSSDIHEEALFKEMYESLENGECYKIEGMKNKTKDGEIYEHDQTLTPVTVHGQKPDYFLAISEI